MDPDIVFMANSKKCIYCYMNSLTTRTLKVAKWYVAYLTDYCLDNVKSTMLLVSLRSELKHDLFNLKEKEAI